MSISEPLALDYQTPRRPVPGRERGLYATWIVSAVAAAGCFLLAFLLIPVLLLGWSHVGLAVLVIPAVAAAVGIGFTWVSSRVYVRWRMARRRRIVMTIRGLNSRGADTI